MALKTPEMGGTIFYDFHEPWPLKSRFLAFLAFCKCGKIDYRGQSKYYFFENGGKVRFLVGDWLETMKNDVLQHS